MYMDYIIWFTYIYINFQTNKPKLKSIMKERRDSGVADTSDADTDGKNTPSATPDHGTNATHSCDETKENNGNKELNSAYVFRKTGRNNTNVEDETTSTCDKIKHNTVLYNPNKLNKGQYGEVKFKNDLIFDLDM